MDTTDKPLSQSTTVWGALAILVGAVLKGVFHLDDETVQTIVDSLTTVLFTAGPLIIIYGRYRLGQKLTAALQASAPTENTAAPAASVSTPSNPAAGL